MKWAKGGGERRESEREHDFSDITKKEGRRERPEARKKHAVQRRGSIFFTPGAAQGSFVAGWRGPPRGVFARPEGASAARCRPACQPGSGRPGHVASCRNLHHLHWRMCASSHRRTCLSRSTEERVAWEPAPAWQESATSRRCCRRSSTRGGGRRRDGQACKLRAHMSQQSGQRGAASGRR